MADVTFSPKSPKDIVDSQKWLFEHLRSFLALSAVWAFGAALFRSDALTAGLPPWLCLLAAGIFVLLAGVLSIAYVLQTADLLVGGAYWIMKKMNLQRYFSEVTFRRLAFWFSLPAFAAVCGIAVVVILAPFYPDLVPLRGQ